MMRWFDVSIGRIVFSTTTGQRGTVQSIRKVRYGLHRLATVQWDDGTTSDEYPANLKPTPVTNKKPHQRYDYEQ